MMETILINMIIVSDSETLQERIATFPVPDHLTVQIKTCQMHEVKQADVLIVDTSSADETKNITTHCFEQVLYGVADQEASKLLRNPTWTAFWSLPCSDEMMSFYLRQLYASVMIKKEHSMTSVFLDSLIDSIPDLVWFKDLRGSHLKVNDAFCRSVGKTKAQCEGRGHYYIWDLEPDEYAKGEYVCLETEEQVIEARKTCMFDEIVKSKTGLRQFKTYKSPLFDQSGEMFGTVGVARDVTDLQNISRELEVILSSIPFATLIADMDDSIVSANPKFCEYFTVEAEKVMKMKYSDVCDKILGTSSQHLVEGEVEEIKYNSEGNQSVFQVQQHLIHDIFGNPFGIFFFCFDVTNEYELQNKLKLSANTDFLTKLYNRRYFYEVISQKKDLDAISLVYFDIDDFKSVNDTYGHRSGDNALILMSDLLKEAFPKQLIARLGGDEFVVAFFGKCVDSQLAQLVNSFIDKTNEVFSSLEFVSSLSVSAGIVCNGNSSQVDVLLSCADDALYAAKAKGKACYTIYKAKSN